MKKRVRAIIVENGKILLIHRIKADDDYWVFPGGGVDEEDEDEIMALKRECMEELGVEVASEKYVCSEIVAFDGVDQEHRFHICRVLGGEVGCGNGPEYADNGLYEGSHVPEWLSLEDLEKTDLRPENMKRIVENIINNK
ncbi:MAG: NUDIX domain-containing protein [Candidatus Paceibacterota bacterium]|jgi:8-oxo-dGTP pyrophosphatase MutT (NUDIX family)